MEKIQIHRRFTKGKITALYLITAVLLLAVGLTVYATSLSRTLPDHVVCKINLRRIHVALMEYASQNEGQFPDIGKKGVENLSVLKEYFHKEHNWLICPAERKEKMAYYYDPQKLLDNLPECSYFYVPGFTYKDPPDTIILGDRKQLHPYGINYITIDGTVGPEVPQEPNIAWIVAKTAVIIGIIVLLIGIWIGRKSKSNNSPVVDEPVG